MRLERVFADQDSEVQRRARDSDDVAEAKKNVTLRGVNELVVDCRSDLGFSLK